MYTGDEYLDAKYNYYPQVLTGEQLLRAVQTRFPKLPNTENMNRYELFKFYMEHIFPRPQRRGVMLEGMGQRHRIKPKKEKDSWTVPPDRPDPRLKKLGIHFFYEDEVEQEVERRIRLKAALIAQARGKQFGDFEPQMQGMAYDENPQPSSSTSDQNLGPPTSTSDQDFGLPTSTPDQDFGPPTSTSDLDFGPPASTADQDFGRLTSTSDEEPAPSTSTSDEEPVPSASTSQRQQPGPSTSTSTSDEDPRPSVSTSRRIILKRGPPNKEKSESVRYLSGEEKGIPKREDLHKTLISQEPEPPKKKRKEITWP